MPRPRVTLAQMLALVLYFALCFFIIRSGREIDMDASLRFGGIFWTSYFFIIAFRKMKKYTEF
jgi:hypothetical protein